MARLTGHIIEEMYASGKRENSMYQEQRLGAKLANTHIDGSIGAEIMYYVDKNTGSLKMKNTCLLG